MHIFKRDICQTNWAEGVEKVSESLLFKKYCVLHLCTGPSSIGKKDTT